MPVIFCCIVRILLSKLSNYARNNAWNLHEHSQCTILWRNELHVHLNLGYWISIFLMDAQTEVNQVTNPCKLRNHCYISLIPPPPPHPNQSWILVNSWMDIKQHCIGGGEGEVTGIPLFCLSSFFFFFTCVPIKTWFMHAYIKYLVVHKKFGEHERSVRVARGAAETNSNFLSALQISQVYP